MEDFCKELIFEPSCNHQFLSQEFLFQNLSNWKQMLRVRPHEDKKTFLLFHNPPPEKELAQRMNKRMSKQSKKKKKKKSKSASTSQQAEECSKTYPLKIYLYLKRKQRGTMRDCTEITGGRKSIFLYFDGDQES